MVVLFAPPRHRQSDRKTGRRPVSTAEKVCRTFPVAGEERKQPERETGWAVGASRDACGMPLPQSGVYSSL